MFHLNFEKMSKKNRKCRNPWDPNQRKKSRDKRRKRSKELPSGQKSRGLYDAACTNGPVPCLDQESSKVVFNVWCAQGFPPEDVEKVTRAVNVIMQAPFSTQKYFIKYLPELRLHCYEVYELITRKIPISSVYTPYCLPLALESIKANAECRGYPDKRIGEDDIYWVDMAVCCLKEPIESELIIPVVIKIFSSSTEYQGIVDKLLEFSSDNLLYKSGEALLKLCATMVSAVTKFEDVWAVLEYLPKRQDEKKYLELESELLQKLVFGISTVDEAVAVLDFLSKYTQRRNGDVMLDCEQIINIVSASKEDRRLAEIVHGFFVASLEKLVELDENATVTEKWFDSIISYSSEFKDLELLETAIERLAKNGKLTDTLLETVKDDALQCLIDSVRNIGKLVQDIESSPTSEILERAGLLPKKAEFAAMKKFYGTPYARSYVESYGLHATTISKLVDILSKVPEEEREKLQDLLLSVMKKKKFDEKVLQYFMRVDLNKLFFARVFCSHKIEGTSFFEKNQKMWLQLCKTYGTDFLHVYSDIYGFLRGQRQILAKARVPFVLTLRIN